jgi:lipid-A-disaccharide synthase
VRVIYYISPQVWAWGEDRIGIIKKCVEKILVFFRFEEDLYRRRGVNVEFVGHPLAETVRPSMRRDDVMKKYALLASAPLIALLPGSRKAEVASLLKTMARAARLIRAGLPDAQFAVAKHR